MAEVFLGLGSNVGDRRRNLEAAILGIRGFSRILGISSLYETPALLPPGAKKEWNRPFYNLVLRIETELSPRDLLGRTQGVETALGREKSEKWAPRVLDIDLLHYGGARLDGADLCLPHPRIAEREFVLDPLAELSPDLRIAGDSVSILAKRHPKRQPRLMGILNLTPDSFSDGGLLARPRAVEEVLDRWDAVGVSILDIGAESTRPGSDRISAGEEWGRLGPVLERIRERYATQALRPKVSVDTYHAETAAKALASGADLINDVGGLCDDGMVDILRESECDYVLMHSLAIPPGADRVLPEDHDPVADVKVWMEAKLERLERGGIARRRVLCDPGIGFGKTALQSLTLLKRFGEFRSLGCRLLAGHSRKSFFRDWSAVPAAERDIETLGVSFALVGKGVDVLRVHDPVLHHRAFLAARHVIS